MRGFVLFVVLRSSNCRPSGVLVAGDLYHYAEERTLHRMPTREQTTATPASRTKIEDFVVKKTAQLWIGHSNQLL
jgi:hypothetical protein